MGGTNCFSFHMFKRPKKLKSATTLLESSTSTTVSNHLNTSPLLQPPSTFRIQGSDDLRRVFAKFDVDNNGKISIDELESVLRMLGSSSDPETEAMSMMREVDADGDGCIGFEEFALVIRTETDEAKCLEDLRSAFAVYDRDGNGLISVEELHWVMKTVMKEKATMAQCEGMIRAVDRDGDGNISFEEFLEMMTAVQAA